MSFLKITASALMLMVAALSNNTSVCQQAEPASSSFPPLTAATSLRWRVALDNTEHQLQLAVQDSTQLSNIRDLFNRPDLNEPQLTRLIHELFTPERGPIIDFRSTEELHHRYAAYARATPDTPEHIYINRDWLESAPTSWITQILLEEYGHALEARLHSQALEGDTGARLAALLMDFVFSEQQWASLQTELDQHELRIDGSVISVQFASLNFSNAYSIYLGEVAGNTYFADKEENQHHFAYTSQGAASIDDQRIEDSFSGNDVVVELTIGGTPYYGWISRPIKSVGIVRGFYFWVDGNFTTFNDATVDGNQDGDANPADNNGFVLVVDQTFFDNLPVAENIGGIDYKFVGSSSDRVDDALNDLIPVPAPPQVQTDLANGTPGTSGGAALESGGINNTTAGSDAFGNVLTNDSSDGSSLQVTGIGTSAADQTVIAGTTSADGTIVMGLYGTLTIGADGSYAYTVNDNLPEVELLRLSTHELSETFIYSISDDIGSSTGYLSISIQGSNDNPVAVNDYNIAKESLLEDGTEYTATDPLGSKATGNVLDNDTDVDGYAETKAIQGISGSASVSGLTVNDGTTELTFLGANNLNSVNDNTDRAYLKISDTDYRALYDDAGNVLVVTMLTNLGGNDWLIELSADIHAYADGAGGETLVNDLSSLSGSTILFTNSTAATLGSAPGGSKVATLNSATSTATTTVNLSLGSISGTVASGMSVSGNGVPVGANIVAVTYDGSGNPITIVVDQALTSQVGDILTFNGSAGTTITGEYGDLILNGDGSYTYCPFPNNPNIAEGQTVQEQFDYTMIDAAGADSTATLFISILGSGVNDPNASADSTIAVEAGGTLNGTAGTNPTGNVLTNDSSPTGAILMITGAKSEDDATTTTVSTNTLINGRYGQLSISNDGAYTYILDNTHPEVETLRDASETLIDPFIYFLTDNGGLQDIASLEIKIQGANDAPIAVNDSTVAIEAGGVQNGTPGLDPSGNVLTNDTDVDDLASELKVTAIRTGSVEGSGTTGSIGTALTGMYGTLTIEADGSWVYTLDNDNTTVNNLQDGQTLTESFNYDVTDRIGTALSDTALLVITIQGANDLINVNNVFVNEASPYAVFTVSGVAGQTVTLALSDTQGLPDYDTKATLTGGTADIGQSLEYYDGTQWLMYDGDNPPNIPAGDTLLVRVPVNQDGVHEGNESFSLVVTGDNTATGIGTINDEGEGDVYLSDNTSGSPNMSGDPGYPTTLDDDQDDDGDGVTNSQEVIDGTDPNDPCDYDSANVTLTQGGDWNSADCDGDGVTNGQEVTDMTDPNDPCDYNAANITLT